MSEQVRVTYAQKKLLDLLQERKLKSWCEERNVPHATLYKLATGNMVSSFIVMSSLVPYFAPAEWVYFTDEEIPYEVKTLETWNPEDTSLFIKKHKHDYMEVAKKYEISKTNARNIFVNRRANITLLQMRKMAKDVNPEEFFIPADETTDGIEVVGEKDSYVGLVQTVSSYAYRRKCPVVVDKINSGNTLEEILVKFNQFF